MGRVRRKRGPSAVEQADPTGPEDLRGWVEPTTVGDPNGILKSTVTRQSILADEDLPD